MTPLYFAVIPAQAGIQEQQWMPVCTGMMSNTNGNSPC